MKNPKKSIDLVEITVDEVALEGLDGITLEALWQRLSIRLGETLPFKDGFMEQIWDVCIKLNNFAFYELEESRNSLIIYDRYELEYLNGELEKDIEQKEIYVYCPVEDAEAGIKGSCATYYTRKNISDLVRKLMLSEAINKYGQKLVIVASQTLRERSLMLNNIDPTFQLNLSHYCLLERIGRTRYMGDITIKKSSVKEDAKTLFYLRKGLQDLGLIRKQVYFQGNSGGNYNGVNTGSLVHLARFFNTRKPKVIIWAEHLINYLKSKEKYAAEYSEVKSELKIDYSIKKFFKIHLLQKIFNTDVKVPYRSYYPNSLDKEWQCKNNTAKERIIKLVTLVNPNIEINDIWRTEEVEDDEVHFQLDPINQKFNVPFLKQAYRVVESKGSKGASQMGIAAELKLTKLVSRTLVRNLVKTNVVSTYLDDVGRQRTTKFVSKKFDAKSSVKKQLELEISKFKEHSESMQCRKVKEKEEDKVDEEEKKDIETVDPELAKPIEIVSSPENNSKDEPNEQLLEKANDIFRRYKLFKNGKRYKYTSSKKLKKELIPESTKEDLNNKNNFDQNDICVKKISDRGNENIEDSDFYKNIETKLIVQKPICKKKSQKTAVVGFIENVHNSDSNNKHNSISYRLLRRANIIIENVKKHRLIDDPHRLVKYINAEEDKEGLEIKIDKHSLLRLLQKLAEDNFIKNITLIMKNKTLSREKEINFICDPSINENDSIIQTAVQLAKLKFCMSMTSCYKIENSAGKFSNRLGKKYGYSPKFIRMRTMHTFLYYLIYDPPKNEIPKEKFLENLEKEGISTDDIRHLNLTAYSNEINWKLFIPPLQKHGGYESGWALMSDILLRLPLMLFVKIHNVNIEVPGLMEYLNHPIKKYLLVNDIPQSIRNFLYLRRKYIFSIHENVSRLCYLGLVQFGPQVLKEKHQVFIYLNRHAELLDTTASAAGYHRIEDKPYPKTKFTFDSFAAIENYWYEMWNICINTCLGGRSVVEGKDILLEDLTRKVEMLQAMKPKTTDEAKEQDTGFIPGDQKGAAGIDSAFFSHLKRNWDWTSTTPKTYDLNDMEPIKLLKPVKTTKIGNLQPRKIVSSKKRISSSKQRTSTNSNVSTENISDVKASESSTKSATKAKRDKCAFSFPSVPNSKPPKIIRKVLPRKPMRKRVKYDEMDYGALQHMDKLRVDWEQHEDNILLVCRVAMVYLCPNPRRNLVTFTAIRDILRSYSFTSYNKTSRACQRRLLYMLKQPKTVNSVLLGVEEVKQDYFVNKRFGGFVDSTRGEDENPVDYEKRIENTFKDLVAYIAKKYYNISNMEQRDPVTLPKTIQEFNIFYKLKLPTKTIASPGISKEVREVNDIHTATINSVIHSSMCCGKEKRSWAYQLFKVYQQYPEYLLRSAMCKIRADQMVTMKKNYMCAHKKFGNCMPMSSSQYQLSSAYYYKFQTKWPYEIFSESYGILLSLFENYKERTLNESVDGVEVKSGLGGIVTTIHDFINSDCMDIDIEIPDQIIMLDPKLPEKDEVYQRIASRYQSILEGLSEDYTNQLKNSVNNVESNENVMPQIDSNCSNVENVFVNNEQQNFVEIRCAKRPIDCDSPLPETKQQKVDNVEREKMVEKDNDSNANPSGVQQDFVEIRCAKRPIDCDSPLPETKQQKVDNVEREKMVEKDNDPNANPSGVQQDFVEIRCAKRPINCDSPLSETKRQKIDNIESEQIAEKNNDANALDIVNIEDTIKVVNEGDSCEKDQSSIDDELNLPLVNCSSVNINELNEPMKIDSSNKQVLSTIQSISVDDNILVKNNNINNQLREVDNNSNIEKSDNLTVNDSTISEQLNSDNNKTNQISPEQSTENNIVAVRSSKLTCTESSRASSIRVNELLKRVQTGNFMKDVEKRTTDVHDVRTRQTRIAMLKMREELHDLTFQDNHHAHEYFVVNSFRLLYSLIANGEDKAKVSIYQGIELPQKLLPMNIQVANKILEDVRKFAIFPKDPILYDDFKNDVNEEGIFEWNVIDEICKFIKAKAEFGATLHELVTNFEHLNNKLADILSLLSERRIVLRAGIVAVRYIYFRYINPWIIHSYKILRLERESHQAVSEGSVYVLDNEENSDDKDKETKRITTAANLFYNTSTYPEAIESSKKSENLIKETPKNESPIKELSQNESSIKESSKHDSPIKESLENESPIKELLQNPTEDGAKDADESLKNHDVSPKRLRRNRTVLLKQKDIYRAAKLLDFNTAEEIKVIIKPWIRIDGVLNRRVLDRMLGAVLCYCIEKPGVSLTLVQTRFTPAIQPYHTRELIEILVKLGCVKMTVQRAPKVTLFSKPAKLDLTGNPDLTADSDSIAIEPTIQASLRFGMFLSNRSYNLDFLSSL